jgi:membrane-associated protease RseP (regulator of RpoE activity)
MAELNPWLIALLVVAGYGAAVYALYRTGKIGPDRPLSLFGPALMIKTKRGRSFLDRVGRFRRLWSVLGDGGLVLALAAMAVIVGVLAFDATLALHVPRSMAPTPQEALGIPGLNPIIPLGYGLVALIIGVVLHELMHGVLARSQNIGVKSLGILWFVVPIGAFVEQDEEEMQRAPRRHRDRVAAAGVLANFLLTALFFFLLSGVLAWGVAPNADGVGISYVVPGTPAANASIAAGDTVTALNGQPTLTNSALLDSLAASHAGQTVNLTLFNHARGGVVTIPVTLAPLSSYTHNASDAQKGFLGVSPLFLPPAVLLSDLRFPLTSSLGPLAGLTAWIALPVVGVSPLGSPTTAFYHLTGPFAGSDPGAFWLGVNLLYWLTWMNLLLGLSNALPLVPLDGGLLFRDAVAGLLSRFRRGWDEKRRDRFAGNAVAASSALVILLIVWQFVAPRL